MIEADSEGKLVIFSPIKFGWYFASHLLVDPLRKQTDEMDIW